MMRDWLVVHDYGTGGVWAIITADSQGQITEKYRDLTVYSERPQFITDAKYERIARTQHYGIEDTPDGWLASLLRHHQVAHARA